MAYKWIKLIGADNSALSTSVVSIEVPIRGIVPQWEPVGETKLYGNNTQKKPRLSRRGWQITCEPYKTNDISADFEFNDIITIIESINAKEFRAIAKPTTAGRTIFDRWSAGGSYPNSDLGTGVLVDGFEWSIEQQWSNAGSETVVLSCWKMAL